MREPMTRLPSRSRTRAHPNPGIFFIIADNRDSSATLSIERNRDFKLARVRVVRTRVYDYEYVPWLSRANVLRFLAEAAVLEVLPMNDLFLTVQSSGIFVGFADGDTAEDSGEALSLIVTKHNRWLKIV